MTIALPRPRFTIPFLTILGATLAMAVSLSATLTTIRFTAPVATPSTDIVGGAVVAGVTTLVNTLEKIPGETGAIIVTVPPENGYLSTILAGSAPSLAEENPFLGLLAGLGSKIAANPQGFFDQTKAFFD
jgi:hypothetical protein